jgi:protoporphyrinogen oxidase
LKDENVVIKTNYTAKRIKKVNNSFQIEFINGKIECFNQVILTIPSSIAAKLCLDLNETEKEKLNQIKYLGVVCASLLLKKSLSGFYVTNITDPGINFTGIIEMSALVDKKEFKGNTLVYLPRYLNPEDPFYSSDDDQIKEEFFSSFKKIYPEIGAEDILEFQIARAKNVFALSTINYSKKLPDVKTSVPGLFILNSAHIINGTLNVNETVQLADKYLGTLIEE